VIRRRGGSCGVLAGRFEGGSQFFCALEGTPDIVVIGAAVECEQLEAMRALHLKALADLLGPLPEHLCALGAFDLDFFVDHRRAYGRGTQNQSATKHNNRQTVNEGFA